MVDWSQLTITVPKLLNKDDPESFLMYLLQVEVRLKFEKNYSSILMTSLYRGKRNQNEPDQTYEIFFH